MCARQWARGQDRGSGPSWALAPTTPSRARAMAPGTTGAWCPGAPRRWERVHRRTGAGPRRSGIPWGWCARRSGRWRLPCTGERDAQAPSTHPRRAWVVPVGVLPPWGRRGPEAEAAGTPPRHCSRALGGAQRVTSPMAAPMGTATGPGPPRRAWRASPTGGQRQGWTGARRACARRPRRAGCAVPGRTSACKTRWGAGVGHTPSASPRR